MHYEKIFNTLINKLAVISVTIEYEKHQSGDIYMLSCANIVVTLIGNDKIVLNKLVPFKPLPMFSNDYTAKKHGYNPNLGREAWNPLFPYDCEEVARELNDRAETELNRILEVLNVQ